MEHSNIRIRLLMRWLIAAFFAIGGISHFMYPAVFLEIIPGWVPFPQEVNWFAGACSLAGSIGLVTKQFRWWAGVLLALYIVCVWPANFKHAFDHILLPPVPDSWWYHGPRLALQPVLAWWALFSADVIDWPFRSGQNRRDRAF
jgi:uncharacterized membrane protein